MAAVLAVGASADVGGGGAAGPLLYSSNWSPDFRQSEIFSVPTSGGERTAVVPSAACEGAPIVSPDGAKLAFVRGETSCDEYAGHLHVAPLAVGPAIDVSPGLDGVAQVVWSPDSARLAFWSAGDVYMAAADGTALVQLGPGRNPSWSPDGRWISFDGWEDDGSEWGTDWVKVAEATGNGVRKIVEGWSAAWSPDGTWIAFGHLRGDSAWIGIVRADGTEQRDLAEGRLPAWSPDGTRIAFVGCGGVCVIPRERGLAASRLAEATGEPGELVWSPDGKWIAFTTEDEGAYVVAGDGSRIDRLTSADASSPVWSPDGSRLALTVDDVANYVVVVAVGGGPALRVAEGSDQYSSASWSRDGARLYYSSVMWSNDFDVWVYAEGGGQPRALTSDPLQDIEPAWSPDGSRIAFVRGPPKDEDDFDFGHRYAVAGSIYVMRADGTGVRRITTGRDDHSPAWSPDGSRLVFERAGALWIVYVSGAPRLRRLTAADYTSRRPAWSPDGKLIVFERWYEEDDADSITIVLAAGGAPRRLTDGDAEDGSPEWSANGAWVIFDRNVGSSVQLHVVGRNGGEPKPVTSPSPSDACGVTDAQMPTWSPTGEIAFLRSCGDPDILALSAGQRRERTIMDSRADELWPDWRQR